jgi:RNA polymerase sigma-70 factor (ECF subfamily)
VKLAVVAECTHVLRSVWPGTGYSPPPLPDAAATHQASFAAAVLAELDALHAFAWRLARNASLAEDLVQDTFARAMAARLQFRPGSNLKAWLFRILRNAYLDDVRRARRIQGGGTEPSEGDLEDGASELLRGDLEIERLRGMVADDIEAALMKLGEEARTVVLLDLEGLTEAEIGEVMGTPPGTVKSRLSRARARLRQLLAEYAR